MDYEELFAKYQELLREIDSLKSENKNLKEKLGIVKQQTIILDENRKSCTVSTISRNSESREKIELFMALFKTRNDVYARRWQNKEGKSGYSPACLNEWKAGLCGKPKVKCADCDRKSYSTLDGSVIEEHLRGNVVVGVYPMYPDETCCFLAVDFDDEGWQQDVVVLRNSCKEFDIPVAIERSRSGNGGHAWLFFEKPIAAALARRFGTALLTYSMNMRHELSFKSYDRLFPNQDTISKGGLGNLIALTLQFLARKGGNSVFVDENFEAYTDQWEFLSSIQKLSEDEVKKFIVSLSPGSELGSLRNDDEEERIPWEANKAQIKMGKADFPIKVTIVRANMLYILKAGFSQRALNGLKRLAAFRNPEFYKAQAMRMPTFNKPRVISCSDETNEYLCLPKGCETDVANVLNEVNVDMEWVDKGNLGRPIDVDFVGQLREDQQSALHAMLKYDNGVLAATTAFGKTVLAAKLISERKVSTLVLVHRQQLLSQWNDKLTEFLKINEELPALERKRGRQKSRSIIGQLGAGKDNLSGIIDVAVMQSLNSKGGVKECVKNYGMVIVDECHHVSAFSFEQILKSVNAKFVYGLTATPARKDGHHPIIFMHCGPVRYRDDAKKQAEKRSFEHYIIPRFTAFRLPIDKDEKELSIQDIYAEIVHSEVRNQLIADDVIKSYESGRNSIILTERTAHVEVLAKKLHEKIPNVIVLTGDMGSKETKEVLAKIAEMSPNEQITIVATGRYIGEGFDEPRLDTLFLAMPISWKGTLQQYAGRLHRLSENKSEVQIYDYADIHIRVLGKMYNRRLSGYAAIGYKAKGESVSEALIDIIFGKNNFWPVYSNDLLSASREVFIVSPFVTKSRVAHAMQCLTVAVSTRVKVTVMTRPVGDFTGKNCAAVQSALDLLTNAGVNVIFRSNIHQKFAIIDQRIVWYGSINLLSFGSAEESIMRLENSNIANELIRNIETKGR